jgi:ATPase subunit of ABC transporter with duplicated ATPase domains
VADAIAATLPEGRVLYAPLSLGIGRERIGIIGRNGSGKSTLLRQLAGLVRPTSGEVRHVGRVGYLAQEPPPADGCVADALGVGAKWFALHRVLAGSGSMADLELAEQSWDLPAQVTRVMATVRLAHVALTQEAATLSGGERTRLALARLLLEAPDVLLLDEPTNHLDRDGRTAVAELVRSWPGGVVVVSHDRALLDSMQRLIDLSPLGVREFGGNYSAYREARDAEQASRVAEAEQADAALARAEQRMQALRERKARLDARGARSRSTSNQSKLQLNFQQEKAEASVGRLGAQVERTLAASRERRQAARALLEVREPTVLDLPSSGLHATALVLEASQLSYTPPGATRAALAPLTCALYGPERVAVTGANGSGKTTLLKLVAGALSPSSGQLRRGVSVEQVAYLDQQASLLGGAGSLAERYCTLHPSADITTARHALARAGFRGAAGESLVQTLSGGERLRAALACVLLCPTPPALLLLDEPTNHLDLDAITAVEQALRGYDGAMLVVSHDAAFLEALGVQRTIHLASDGRMEQQR